MDQGQSERALVLLESIAKSLAKIANPPMMVDDDGRARRFTAAELRDLYRRFVPPSSYDRLSD